MKSRPNRPKRAASGPKTPRGPGRPKSSKPEAAARRPKARPEPGFDASEQDIPQVAPPGVLAEAGVTLAEVALQAVVREGRRPDRAMADVLRRRRDLAASDRRFLTAAVDSLFRWWGWVEPAAQGSIPGQLLLATLMDLPQVHPACRIWARMAGREPGRLLALAEAPSWTAKSDGFKRMAGRPVAVDPWRLFPAWFREAIPLPPGDGPPKARQVELIQALQRPAPSWLRVQGADPKRIWDELRELGLRPWLHRQIETAARLDADAELAGLPPLKRGHLEVQDLASQAVGLACDPEPGERWWDVFAVAGHALHLAALMGGKGVVVASDTRPNRLKGLTLHARRTPFRNVSTKPWDGKHVVGKSGSYSGVLVAPPCSALGTWRRHPADRWLTPSESIDRLAAEQAEALKVGAAGVRKGGVLVYSVATLTMPETSAVVAGFLKANSGFQLDPFAHPLTGEPTDGTLTIWPQESDTDAVYLARMIRTA